MITLYGWGPMFDCPSPSPFVMKTEMQLQMLGVTFNRAFADLESVPKHKAPYIIDDGLLVEDSNFIRAHVEARTGRSLLEGLDDAERAASWAIERMAEDHLVDMIVIERWLKDANFNKGPALFFSDVPESARASVMQEVREGIAATMQGNGAGRHSADERLQLAAWDLEAIASTLAAKPYLFGDVPTAADASVSSILISCATEYFDTPLSGLVRSHGNLVDYMDRVKSRFFARNLWPQPEFA